MAGSILEPGPFRQMKIWAACVIFPEIVSIAVTLFRLYYRRRTRGLWWDDYFALAAVILVLPFYSTAWMVLVAPKWTPNLQIAASISVLFSYWSSIWATRISLTLSVSRILPPSNAVYRLTLILAGVFVILCIAVNIEYATLCAINSDWREHSPYICAATRLQSIFSLIADFICDVFLVYLPLRLFWHVNLRRGARLMILTGFGGSALVAVITLGYAILLLTPFGTTGSGIITRAMSMHVVALCSLLACNVLVIFTYFYQVRHREDTDFIADTTELTKTTRALPTPDLISRRGRTTTAPSDDSYGTQRTVSLVLTDVSMSWSETDSAIHGDELRSKDSKPSNRSYPLDSFGSRMHD